MLPPSPTNGVSVNPQDLTQEVCRGELSETRFRYSEGPKLELAFSRISLRELCEIRARAERQYGTVTARQLRARLADLEAAENVSVLIAGTPTEIEGSDPPQMTITFAPGYRIIFRVNHNPIPRLNSGAVDWSNVTMIQLQKIEEQS